MLSDRRYVAEPKLDGQRALVHIRDGRTVACYSRPGRDLLRHPGMAWLRTMEWPAKAAVLDGEACAGDGHEGIQAVFEQRNRIGGDISFMAFDLLELDGQRTLHEPLTDRRKRLEDLFAIRSLPRVGLVPVTEDAATLYETWIGWGGEGIVLKEPGSIYRPDIRSPAWLKVKPKLTLEVVVTGGSSTLIPWGDLGQAVMLELQYEHPRHGTSVMIRQAVRVRREEEIFRVHAGRRAELVCWGVMPSGMLRHPLFVRWSASGRLDAQHAETAAALRDSGHASCALVCSRESPHVVGTMEDVLSVLRQASQPLGPMGSEWLTRQERSLRRDDQ